MKLLLVEDEKEIADTLKDSLQKLGFAVDLEYTGKAGYESAYINQYDCIILDLNLPEIDGLEIARRLRKEEIVTPIIMLTARSNLHNKLEGFEQGADDYVTKPFSLKELEARIRAIVKRSSSNKSHFMDVHGYEFDISNNSLKKDNQIITLSNKETAVLEYLFRNKGVSISAEELLEHVWDSEIDPFSDTLKTHIKTLRKKLESTPIIIRTLRGKGYILD